MDKNHAMLNFYGKRGVLIRNPFNEYSHLFLEIMI